MESTSSALETTNMGASVPAPRLLAALALACLLALPAGTLAARVLRQADQPPAPTARTYFIFGYGSLLNTASTEKTNCGLSGFAEGDLDGLRALLQRAAANNNASAGDNNLLTTLEGCQVQGQRVVRIRGLKRGWYFPSTGAFPVSPFSAANGFGASQLALGAVTMANENITGLIYQVDEAAYNATLLREVGYQVVQIPSNSPDITVLGGPPLPDGATVAYFGQNRSTIQRPSLKFPIAYSYIDIWLGGAVDLQNRFGLSGPTYLAGSGGKYSSFLEETIKTTDAWSRYIVNDRSYPNRPFVQSRYAGTIDTALWNFVSHAVLQGVRYPGQLR